MTREQETGDGGPVADPELLRRYADEKSETAFAELVRRHLPPVYAFALRRVNGDAHLAEDVAQVVFTTLARKAGSLAGRSVLGGWLCRTTHFAARDVVRTESRRRTREQEALIMQESLGEDTDAAIDWAKLHPVIDQTLGELNDADRDAVWLRFFEGRSFADVGARLRFTENAARMRVERALDKLHAALSRRGITSTSAALGVALANQAAASVPVGIAASVTSAALAGATAGGSVSLWLAFFTMSKIKVGIVGVIIAAIGVTGVVELRANRELRAELGSLHGGSDDAGWLQKENLQLSAALKKLGDKNPEANELARLQRRAAVLTARPPGVVDAELKAASTWNDVGRATPEAAFETMHRAIFNGDIDALADFVIFSDDTPKNREAFMAHFSEVVRARYRTPERLYAATLFDAAAQSNRSPNDAFQILNVDDQVRGNGTRLGQKRVQVWYSLASGQEFESAGRWQPTPNGWVLSAFSLSSWDYVQRAINPLTGERLPAGPNEHLPLKKE